MSEELKDAARKLAYLIVKYYKDNPDANSIENDFYGTFNVMTIKGFDDVAKFNLTVRSKQSNDKWSYFLGEVKI